MAKMERHHESDESNESEEMIGAESLSIPWFFLLPFVRFVRFVVPQLFLKKIGSRYSFVIP
jgi:hypothetical protein